MKEKQRKKRRKRKPKLLVTEGRKISSRKAITKNRSENGPAAASDATEEYGRRAVRVQRGRVKEQIRG